MPKKKKIVSPKNIVVVIKKLQNMLDKSSEPIRMLFYWKGKWKKLNKNNMKEFIKLKMSKEKQIKIEDWGKTADIANKYGKDDCISPLKEAIDNLLSQQNQKLIEEIQEKNCGVCSGSIIISRKDWERIKNK